MNFNIVSGKSIQFTSCISAYLRPPGQVFAGAGTCTLVVETAYVCGRQETHKEPNSIPLSGIAPSNPWQWWLLPPESWWARFLESGAHAHPSTRQGGREEENLRFLGGAHCNKPIFKRCVR